MTNLFADLPDASKSEVFETLLTRPGAVIERIVSHGQITPADAPFMQDHDEWVLLLSGAARMWIDGDGRDAQASEIALAPGDHALIPAGRRHRVIWTTEERPTVWLAVHFR